MSVGKFIAANWPLPEVEPSKEYPLYINLDEERSVMGMPMTIIAFVILQMSIPLRIRNMVSFWIGLTALRVGPN